MYQACIAFLTKTLLRQGKGMVWNTRLAVKCVMQPAKHVPTAKSGIALAMPDHS